MEIIRFLGLGEAEQWEEFWGNCEFLEYYIDIDVKHHLYRLHDFYVELTSDVTEKLNPVLHVFVDGPRLDKYRQGDIDFINGALGLEEQ